MKSKKILILLYVLLLISVCSTLKNQTNNKIEMALIPAGTFLMGNTGIYSGDYAAEDVPVHKVTISRPFLMSKYEITQKLYKEVMGTNLSEFQEQAASSDFYNLLPVEKVSWNDAIIFCNKLSERDGLQLCYSINKDTITCNFEASGYRLPTEAEWEYACKAGSTTDFYTGDLTKLECKLDTNLDEAGWYCGNSGWKSHQIGKKKPNAFGLFDMHGNVWEWCWDWYDKNYFTDKPAIDPKGAISGSHHILRGGAWDYYAESCRSSYRIIYKPDDRLDVIGFRICRTK